MRELRSLLTGILHPINHKDFQLMLDITREVTHRQVGPSSDTFQIQGTSQQPLQGSSLETNSYSSISDSQGTSDLFTTLYATFCAFFQSLSSYIAAFFLTLLGRSDVQTQTTQADSSSASEPIQTTPTTPQEPPLPIEEPFHVQLRNFYSRSPFEGKPSDQYGEALIDAIHKLSEQAQKDVRSAFFYANRATKEEWERCQATTTYTHTINLRKKFSPALKPDFLISEEGIRLIENSIKASPLTSYQQVQGDFNKNYSNL